MPAAGDPVIVIKLLSAMLGQLEKEQCKEVMNAAPLLVENHWRYPVLRAERDVAAHQQGDAADQRLGGTARPVPGALHAHADPDAARLPRPDQVRHVYSGDGHLYQLLRHDAARELRGAHPEAEAPRSGGPDEVCNTCEEDRAYHTCQDDQVALRAFRRRRTYPPRLVSLVLDERMSACSVRMQHEIRISRFIFWFRCFVSCLCVFILALFLYRTPVSKLDILKSFLSEFHGTHELTSSLCDPRFGGPP